MVGVANEVAAYYTRLVSGETFERHSRTGPYADIIVEVGEGQLVFWRGTSYLPYWKTDTGSWSVGEIVPRRGDGPARRPDRVNTYSRVAIIESTPERAVICWRYLPEFSGANPHEGVRATSFVEEYFTITADGVAIRTVRRGTEKIDDWRDPENQLVQTLKLAANGITWLSSRSASKSAGRDQLSGRPVIEDVPCSPIAWWKFDEAQGDEVIEAFSNASSLVAGHKSVWKPGVSGTALQFDGYNTEVRFPTLDWLASTDEFTVEAWVALEAYPWNWTALVQQIDDTPTGRNSAGSILADGFLLGVDGLGHAGFKLRIGRECHELVSERVLELRKWRHIVGVYEGKSGRVTLYIDGQAAASKVISGGKISFPTEDIVIGKGEPRLPIRTVRRSTSGDSYALDGLLDEVRIHDAALSQEDVRAINAALRPAGESDSVATLEPRRLPAPGGPIDFGARYEHLRFYDGWDNLWRFGDHPDITVGFEGSPCKFVFWRGCGHIPMLVNDRGQWYSNEFNETWSTSGGRGCQEPMSDKESYTNHARIIENTEARVVVHWRYPLIDVSRVSANYDEKTGWSDWADWYYYIYPDGVAAKTMRLWTHGKRNHEWQESMAIMGPGQHPEQVLETSPTLILTSLDGEVSKYAWQGGPPHKVDFADQKVQVVNYRSDYDPFTIGDFQGGNVYSGEVTDYSVFPTWNHWPVAQIRSDGRYAIYPDRTSHSSLTHVFLPTFKEEFGDRPFEDRIFLEGMTNKSAKNLLPLARSWLDPPKATVQSGANSLGYHPGQRAYRLEATGGPILVTLEGSEDSPVVNPCFVVGGWGEKEAAVTLENGKAVDSYRSGKPRTVRTHDLVVWLEFESESTTSFRISPP